MICRADFCDSGDSGDSPPPSVEDLHKNPNVSIYFGETFRKLREEDLRWLTERGDLSGGTNRPALVWSEPRGKRGERTHITMPEAREELGFKSCVLHETFQRDKRIIERSVLGTEPLEPLEPLRGGASGGPRDSVPIIAVLELTSLRPLRPDANSSSLR